MLPVLRTQQHSPMLPPPSPPQQELCAEEHRSPTWHHRLGLWALNWTSDPALGVKVWCLKEEQGPPPRDPDLLSTCNVDSHSSRALVEASPDFLDEDWVPAETDLGLPEEETIQRTVCTRVSEETQLRSVWQTTDFTIFFLLIMSVNDTPEENTVDGDFASTNCLASGKEMHFSMQMC